MTIGGWPEWLAMLSIVVVFMAFWYLFASMLFGLL